MEYRKFTITEWPKKSTTLWSWNFWARRWKICSTFVTESSLWKPFWWSVYTRYVVHDRAITVQGVSIYYNADDDAITLQLHATPIVLFFIKINCILATHNRNRAQQRSGVQRYQARELRRRPENEGTNQHNLRDRCDAITSNIKFYNYIIIICVLRRVFSPANDFFREEFFFLFHFSIISGEIRFLIFFRNLFLII